MNEEQFKILTEKLDFISKMLLLNIVKDLEFSEQVTQLSNLGLKETEIAKILNSTRDKVHSIMRKTKWLKKKKYQIQKWLRDYW